MLGFQNLHTHTTYCDGTLPPEGMVKAALAKGCSSLGFSEHSHVPFDIYYSMDAAAAAEYMSEVRALQLKYEGIIEIFLGLELDYCSVDVPAGLDYTIGTLHYVEVGGEFKPVDAGLDAQKELVATCFGGDFYSFAEAYYSVFAKIVKKTKADIIGHFDLVSKFNIDGSLFDEMHPRYVDAALFAMSEILKERNLFEVNTGAMFRYNKTVPYPSPFLLKELRQRGGEVILSSDSHDGDSIGFMFPQVSELLRSCGFKHIKRLTGNGFVNVDL
ncbi:MAG: histidinol-phosphatase HisJ family protein [Oscillospiraceae bacterium]|nr:histidinol-phosphatase HisJ family protein [Oscillospiraceae bacterium]